MRTCNVCKKPICNSFDRLIVEEWKKGKDGYFHIEKKTMTDICHRHFAKLKEGKR
jgi:hypothetical protein